MTSTNTDLTVEEFVDRNMLEMAVRFARRHGPAGKENDALEGFKKLLRRYLKDRDLTELIDGETGYGVALDGRGRKTSEWDVMHMPDADVLELRDRDLLTVRTTQIDSMAKESHDSWLVAMVKPISEGGKFRSDGETEAAMRAVKPS